MESFESERSWFAAGIGIAFIGIAIAGYIWPPLHFNLAYVIFILYLAVAGLIVIVEGIGPTSIRARLLKWQESRLGSLLDDGFRLVAIPILIWRITNTVTLGVVVAVVLWLDEVRSWRYVNQSETDEN